MLIKIQHYSPVPIYEQLIEEILALIETGELKDRDNLPPIRQLAGQLDVAVNTVARAYQELERKGFVVSNGRKGIFIKRTDTTGASEKDFKKIIITLLKEGSEKEEIEQNSLLVNQPFHVGLIDWLLLLSDKHPTTGLHSAGIVCSGHSLQMAGRTL